MISTLKPYLNQQGFLLLDGGLATELEQRGAKLDDHLWSARLLLDQPELIQQVHYDYLMAGADVLITASYQASFQGLLAAGLGVSQAQDLFRLSVALAEEARTAFEALAMPERLRPLIGASIGPYGAYLADGSEYRGEYGLSKTQLMDFHRERLHFLAGEPIDFLACETIPSALEARVIIALLEELPDAYAYLSFSCRDGLLLNDGTLFSEVVTHQHYYMAF